MQTLLTESSHVLNKALDHLAHIASATIVVPSSWSESRCGGIISGGGGGGGSKKSGGSAGAPVRGSAADFVVTGRPDALRGGRRPFAQQSGGCGRRGDFVSLPASFVATAANSTVSAARLFVAEFAKLRYGVFENFGYDGDRVYPDYYFRRGGLLPTLSADGPVRGRWVGPTGRTGCDPTAEDGEKCFFSPTEKDDAGHACPIGVFPSATRFCGARDYAATASLAPTKQNVLCGGRSAMEVILGSADFTGKVIPNKARAVPDLTPRISVVREPSAPRYVLALETSSSMARGGQWRWVARAAQRLLRHQLPVDSQVAVVTFANASRTEHRMARVSSDRDRARLADAVPDRYHLSGSDGRCVLCAVKRVAHDVLGPPGAAGAAGAHLLLVTRGTSDTLSLTDERVVGAYLRDYGIKLTSVLVRPPGPAASSAHLPFYESASAATGGRAVAVAAAPGSVDFYVDLSAALADAVASDGLYPTERAVRVHRRGFFSGLTASEGEFLLDGTLGRDTLFGVHVEDAEEHGIRSVSFRDSEGRAYGPFRRMSSTYDRVNLKTVSFPAAGGGGGGGIRAPPFNAVSVKVC